jgi:hypothetical protein
MRKNILRLVGVTLSLMLAFSLIGALMPVSQGKAYNDPNVWEEFKVPKKATSGKWALAPGAADIDIGPIARAIDGTLFCYVGPSGSLDDTDYTLFKSTDDGKSWAYTGKVTKTIVAIACSPLDADVVYYVTTDSVYKSENAGGKFVEMQDPTQATDWNAGETITSLDVNYIGDDHVIIIGTMNGTVADSNYGHVWTFDEGVRVNPNWTNQTVGFEYDVLAVALAPDFDESRQMIGVVTTYTTETKTFVTVREGASGWNSKVGDAELQVDNDSSKSVAASRASIAFPSDFDSDVDSGFLNVYVGVTDLVDHGTYSGGDVYEFIGITGVNKSVCLDLDANKNITDVVVDGPEGDCTIIAGTKSTGDLDAIRRSTDGGDTWKSSKKEPTGDAGEVFLAIDGAFDDTGYVWAAVGGLDGGVSLRVDDRLYNQIALINTCIEYINDLSIALGSTMVFMSTSTEYDPDMTDGSDIDMVWRHDGDGWQRIFTETLEDCPSATDPELVEASPYFDEDTAVFIGDINDNQPLLRSTDGGNRFKEQVRAFDDTAIMRGWIVLDNTVVIIGAGDETYKTVNNGKSWKTPAELLGAGSVQNFARSPNYEEDETLLAGTSAGEIWRSTDSAKTWSQLKTSHDTMDASMLWPAFDDNYPDNSTMYCTSSNGGVYRYVKGTSKFWSRIDTKDGCPESETTTDPFQITMGSGIVVAPNVLYATDSSAAGEGVGRSVNPRSSVIDSPYVFFDTVNESIEGTLPEAIRGLWMTPGTNTVIWTIYDDVKIWTLEDILVKKVILDNPEDGSHSGRVNQVTLEWEKLDAAKRYQIHVDTRSDFKGTRLLSESAYKGLSYILEIADAYTGIDLYWRVRVYECEPFRSLWSDKWLFTTELKGAQWNPFKTVEGNPGNVAPAAGATGVPRMPGFQWNSADWATAYELELAEDANFSKITKKVKITDTAWLCDVELAYGKTYYWRVRGISDKSESEWAVGIFTVMEKPEPPPKPVTVAPPQPPVVLPPAPAPITPVYIYVIIAIGAVLVVAVIVLIVTTRRQTK